MPTGLAGAGFTVIVNWSVFEHSVARFVPVTVYVVVVVGLTGMPLKAPLSHVKRKVPVVPVWLKAKFSIASL